MTRATKQTQLHRPAAVLLILFFLFATEAKPLLASDCNKNGLDDAAEIAGGESVDCNENGVPDQCDVKPRFVMQGQLVSYDAGEDADSPEAVDLDGDGDVDLAVKNAANVAVLLNDGEGAFSKPQSIDSGGRPEAITSADLDGDGDIDLAAARNDEVAVLLNNGDATFAPPVNFPGARRPNLITAGDLDGDGNVDLVVGDRPLRKVIVLSNEGEARFAAPVEYDVPESPQSVAFTDLDDDGDTDLVVGQETGVCVLFNEGAGTFRSMDLAVDVRQVAVLKAADLNGDGISEIVTFGRSVDVFLSDGTVLFSYDVQETSAAIAIDLDSDADVDLAVVTFTSVLVFHNDGDGEFGEPLVYGAMQSSSLAGADVDGDGHVDLVLAHPRADAISVLVNSGTATFPTALVSSYNAVSETRSIAAVDVSGDGAPEIVMASSLGIILLENQGDGTFGEPVETGMEQDSSVVAGADMNQDGAMDIAGATGSGRVVVLLNQGDLEFPDVDGWQLGGESTYLVPEDLDGDGDSDLVVSDHRLDGLNVVVNEGDGNMKFSTVRTDNCPIYVATGDLDGDEDADIAVATFSARFITIFLNSGTATVAATRKINFPFALSSVAAGDIDLDGDLDLVTVGGSFEVAVSLNNGDATFVEGAKIAIPAGARNASIADMDLDGSLDLVVLRSTLGIVSVFLNDGDGSFSGDSTDLPVAGSPLAITLADFDGNGYPDIATGNFLFRPPAKVSILLNHTSPPQSEDDDQNGVPDECESTTFRRGDPNADGKTDVSDGIFILLHLFQGGTAPPCEKAGDVDDDGVVRISDAIYVFEHLFRGGPAPSPPHDDCGTDASADELACESYEPCP